MADTEEFRKLLAEAVYRIQRCEAGKPISVIHDELGYALGKRGAGTAIAHWRKGNLPQIRDLERLAEEIIRRSDLSRTWLHKFLTTADYPYVDHFCNRLFPAVEPLASSADTRSSSYQLPFTKSYRALIGRDAIVSEIVGVLNDPNARAIIAIDGIGGIGKTALAQEIVVACREQKIFHTVVWLSGAKENDPGNTDSHSLTFGAVLNAIGNQLNLPELSQLTEQEKERRIHALLHRHRLLVVLDNLETAAEPQLEIGRRLQPLLGISKALFTSRQRFVGDFYAIHLEGLDAAVANQFLRQEATDRRITTIAQANDSELTRITEMTGASPLAMKLVVGQLAFLPVEIILTHLQAAQPLTKQGDTDEYINLYKYIYFPSWTLLSAPSKDLLVAMAHFVPGLGGTMHALEAVSGMSVALLPGYVHELWQLSLMEIGEAAQTSLSEKRYYLHALTKHFVLSDIINL